MNNSLLSLSLSLSPRQKGMLSCQQTQNIIDGKKRIILNPTETQRRDLDTATFAENEVYGVDILISSGEDGKVSVHRSTSASLTSPLRPNRPA